MHIDYAPGRLHTDSPIRNPRVARVITDAERLFEASTGERWPAHAAIQLGNTAVLRCTKQAAVGGFPFSEVLIDVSLDRLQRHPVPESHVLLRAWVKNEHTARIIYSGVEHVQNVAWMVEVFSPGEWMETLADMAREALPAF